MKTCIHITLQNVKKVTMFGLRNNKGSREE